MELGKTWDTCRICRKLEIVVVSQAGSSMRCFLGTADRLCIFPVSLFGEILGHVQTKSVVSIEISVGCEL